MSYSQNSTNGYTANQKGVKTILNWGPATSLAAFNAFEPLIHWNAVVTSNPQKLRDLLTSTSAPVIARVNGESIPLNQIPKTRPTPDMVFRFTSSWSRASTAIRSLSRSRATRLGPRSTLITTYLRPGVMSRPSGRQRASISPPLPRKAARRSSVTDPSGT